MLGKEQEYIMSLNSEHTRPGLSTMDIKQKTKTKAEKTFEELVEESLRLPELSPSSQLPLSMTEILRNSQKNKDVSTKLPQINGGKVQLVATSDPLASEKKRKRRNKSKTNRPKRPSPHCFSSDDANAKMRVTQCVKPSVGLKDNNHLNATTNTEKEQWKKNMHTRHSKRRIAEESESMSVSLTVATYHH